MPDFPGGNVTPPSDIFPDPRYPGVYYSPSTGLYYRYGYNAGSQVQSYQWSQVTWALKPGEKPPAPPTYNPGYQPPASGGGQNPGNGSPFGSVGGPQTPGAGMGGGGQAPGDLNPTYNPGGGGYDYGYNQGGQQGGSSQGNGFQWQSVIGPAFNLLQGILNNKAQNKSEQQNREDVQQRIQQALAQLSPEAIQSLSKLILPQIMAQTSPATQTALSTLASSQARRGIYNSNFGAAQEAGMRGQQINNASAQAFQGAMNLAGQRAGVLTGIPIPQSQPNYNIGNSLVPAASLFTQAMALGRNPSQGQYQAPSPYKVPGQSQNWE